LPIARFSDPLPIPHSPLPAFMLLSLKLQQKNSKIIIVILMMVLLIGAALPGYINKKWSWMDMPQLQTLPQLQTVRKEGLTIPGWQTVKN
jgi:hypothetical protein